MTSVEQGSKRKTARDDAPGIALDPVVDAATFRRVLGCFASGVTVVTSQCDGKIYGMTANAFMSGSLDPPLVVISIARRATMYSIVRTSGMFGISILAEGQEHKSRHFSGQSQLESPPQFQHCHDIPVLADALATIAASVEAVHSCGDHDLFVGGIRHLGFRSGSPLVYFRGEYLRANS